MWLARRNQVPTCCRSKQTDESRSFQVAPQAYRILSVHPGVKDQIAEIHDFDTTSLKACQSAALICNQHEATYHADLGPEIGWSLWWELCCWDSDIHYHICSDWFKLAPQTRQDTAAGDKFTTRLCVYFEKVQLSGCWIVFVTHQRRGPHFGVLMMMKSTANLVPCGWRQHHTLEEKTSFRMLLEGIKMIN